jgi:hypothetical protein
MKAIGKMIKCQVMEGSLSHLAIMKVTLRTDSHMERATTKILIKHILESGEMILSMDLGNRL